MGHSGRDGVEPRVEVLVLGDLGALGCPLVAVICIAV
jgi:hypothetical protein